MDKTLIAGTDGGNVILFDPGALPADIDEQLEKDWGGTAERLRNEGLICWPMADGDGDWVLRVLIDEPPPGEVKAATGEVEIIEAFQVPTGELRLIGGEYFGSLEKRRSDWSGGEAMRIEPGTYRVEIHPGGGQGQRDHKIRWKQLAGRWNVLAHEGIICLGCGGVIGVVISLGVFLISFKAGIYWLAVSAGMAVAGFVTLQTKWQKKVDDAYKEAKRSSPDFVVVMRKIEPAEL